MKKGFVISALVFFILFKTNAQYTKIFEFSSSDGYRLYGSLFSDGAYFYGMTQLGGTNGYGVLFKINANFTSGLTYSKMIDFDGTSNGGNPTGSIIWDGTFLYGMTNAGGANNMGTIFKIKTDGTGFMKLKDLVGTATGGAPVGSIISDGTFLYGMTQHGGTNNLGVIFKIKTDGTLFSKVLDFTGPNGSNPRGSLISDGTFFYGMTKNGGTNDSGVVFKIKPDGTGYAKLLDFTGMNGMSPGGSLILEGAFLYGMTRNGGTNGDGVIFKIQRDGTGYTKLLDFNGNNGSSPEGDLLFDGTFLNGMTAAGGVNGLGIIFK
ncbi:MAG: choice-of-anchor tandem repeat GloVer-containing protein, partial [Bacteroidia bacterium]